MQEEELIAALKQKDENAFKWLVETYRKRLYAIALNLLQDSENAEDVLQETFIKVYESVNTFLQNASLHTWMHRILVRKCLDKMRRQKARNALQAWLPGWMAQEKRPEFNHPGIKMENKEKATVLFNAIKTLPDNQRTAFTLIKIEGLSYNEVSEIMALSSKAIESLISRAKQNLQKKLSS